jgi:hypothetical protein
MDEAIEALAHGEQARQGFPLYVLATAMPTRNALILARGMEEPALAPWMARHLAGPAWRSELARGWLLAYPEAAAEGLWHHALTPPGNPKIDVLAVSPEEHDLAWQALRLLHVQGHWPTLEKTLRRGLAAQTPAPEVDAACAAAHTRLSADPTLWLPTPLPKLPKALDQAFAAATPLQLKAGGTLPADAMRDALMVLALGKGATPYAGLAQLQDTCTPESLAVWARDLLDIWIEHGMPPKARFVQHAQGWLGDDATATRLHKLILAWRAKLDRVRAYEGITALTRIPGNAALTWLAALAEHKRYDDLRTRASAALRTAAEERDMSLDELADCTLPDLGFDAQSRQLLDFGPRQFEVLLDEQLQLRLRERADAGGKPDKWIKALPKPRVSDNAELAAQAKRQLKDLQAQLRALGRRQLQRMEAAMCEERRWGLAHFRAHLVEHPLARVLVQRLILGVYSSLPSKGQTTGIVTPNLLFRIAEDGTPTQANDEPLGWNEIAAACGSDADGGDETARIAIAHPLHMLALEGSAAQMQAWAAQLADYELLQPFEQLGRETAELPPADLPLRELPGYADRRLGTGSLMGLVSQGWKREVGDGGMVCCLNWTLPTPGGSPLVVAMNFEPGWFVAGGVDTTEGQLITGITLHGRAATTQDGTEPPPATWADLSPIARSELLRTLNRLAWWQNP